MFTQKWYLTYFLLPLLINFLQAYLSGWGGEGVCVCVTGWVGMMLCYYVRLEQQAFSNILLHERYSSETRASKFLNNTWFKFYILVSIIM